MDAVIVGDEDAHLSFSVIPGRAERANPESRCATRHPNVFLDSGFATCGRAPE
jgi:hypothetical protein